MMMSPYEAEVAMNGELAHSRGESMSVHVGDSQLTD